MIPNREGPARSNDELSPHDAAVAAGIREINAGASAAMVNRTHRVIRERAKTIKERRSKIRSLWLPVVIFSSLLIGVSIAVWTVLEEYEFAGSQVASYQYLVPVVWSIPISAALLAIVWFRQSRTDATR